WITKEVASNLNGDTLSKLMLGGIPAIRLKNFLDEGLLKFYKKEVESYHFKPSYEASKNKFLGPHISTFFTETGDGIDALIDHVKEVSEKSTYPKSVIQLIHLVIGFISEQTNRSIRFLELEGNKLWSGSAAFRNITAATPVHYDSFKDNQINIFDHLEVEGEASCLLHIYCPPNTGGETNIYDLLHDPTHKDDEYYKNNGGFYYSDELVKDADQIVLTPEEGSLTLFPMFKYHSINGTTNNNRISLAFFMVKLVGDDTIYVYN
ncbi:MAG: hypothetical protein AAFO07_21325, partial [Bacteroidota bacterium]